MASFSARQGNGNALRLAVLLLCVMFIVDHAAAKVVPVGGSSGWLLGNKFSKLSIKAKDQLLFKYPAEAHNVVQVSSADYKSCNAKGQTKRSGYDQIALGPGTYYFICGVSDHCKKGMKVAVTVSK
ncbi:hypothetical protein R1sor_006002 [Riccia sorocarpa]|uniref:Phytocyanin domain-containing protein n=1 Tax=Riccia sorocarpa TaxID=122646 RepID=A0ABD3HQE1_9MARC